MNEKQPDTANHGPMERLTFAPYSDEDLAQALRDVARSLASAEEVILGAKRDQEALNAEIAARANTKHEEALSKLCCPACGNSDLDHMTHLSPEGYHFRRLSSEKGHLHSEYNTEGGGAEEMLAYVDGELKKVSPVEVIACQKCQARQPWPEALQLDWV